MQPALNACVYIVDDDAIVRDAMAWLLRSRRLMSESFESADAFELMLNDKFPGSSAPVPTQAGCILLDVRMPGQSGLALFETLIGNGLAHTWPVIFLSGHADVPTAVDSVKRGPLISVKSHFLTTLWSTESSKRWPCRKSVWHCIYKVPVWSRVWLS